MISYVEALTVLRGLRDLCGYVEDGSAQTVKIFQDDATKTWVVTVDKKSSYGDSMFSAINNAVKDNGGIVP